MIVRLIIFVVIFALLWYLFRSIRSLIDQKTNQGNTQARKTNKDELMVACKQCGVYTPKSHAIKTKHGDFYCCKEHLQQDVS